MCNRFGIEIAAYIGSQESQRYPTLPKETEFILVNKFAYNKDEYDVLLALNEKYNTEVIQLLRKNGFVNIYYSMDWNVTNRIYRKAFMNAFLEMHGINTNEKIIIGRNGKFKIFSGTNQPEEYSSMLMGDFFDIIAPSIYDCEDYAREGSYEYDRVRIEENDIVLDLGANIGMFSCVAAAKGKYVYAFEPTPRTCKLLKQNAALYNNFVIEEYAVCNEDGEALFSINDMSTSDVNSGGNTFERLSRKEGIQQIKVQTIKIDTFVEKNHIEKIDFIKADIEGAERYMLMGAKETLKKFAPKLSLCTYHLPDDEEVLTKLILEANPNYRILYGSKKLYAYLPDKQEGRSKF